VEKIPVIIPARNEELTIGPIVHAFNNHPQTSGAVYVVVDGATTDNTGRVAYDNGAHVTETMIQGKGQVVRRGMSLIRNRTSSRFLLCDADYTGLTAVHIDRMLRIHTGVTIGVPDWPEIPVPYRVVRSWPQISGFRYLPRSVVPKNAHGYLLETQINIQAIKAYMPRYLVILDGLKTRFQWPLSPQRLAELQRDKEWGEKHGLL
jgi:glycosyltransferase involved in cell wall biosynthesis